MTLQPAATPPKIPLVRTIPPGDSTLPDDHLEQLRERFGRLGNG
jgi:hypothetical protein